MRKKTFLRKFLSLTFSVLALLLLYIALSENYDTQYSSTFDYGCRPNGSEPNPDVVHYCIRGPKIFFVETAESRVLSVRQACAVESTARHNPSMNVTVLLTPALGIDFSNDLVKILMSIPKVTLQHINMDVFVHGTPVWEWLRIGKWKASEWKVSHLSDALRFLVVWKYGGMYLDLDIVTLRSLSELKNCVISENWESIASGMLIFDKNHELMRWCMEDFAHNYDPYNFVKNGPGVMTKNLKAFCDVQDVGKVSGSLCGVDVLPPAAAFPIKWDDWEQYLKPVQLNTSIASHFPSSYMIHVWNKYSRNGRLLIGSNSLYERAMKEHCPLVYRHALKFKEV